MHLPPEKCNKIIHLLNLCIRKKNIKLHDFQSLAGKLQHVSFGLPCGVSLFTPVQQAMAGLPKYIAMTPMLKSILSDWCYIIKYMKAHPTSVLQLVVEYPDYIGYSDACGLGAGGIWSSGLKHLPPFLWQIRWL